MIFTSIFKVLHHLTMVSCCCPNIPSKIYNLILVFIFLTIFVIVFTSQFSIGSKMSKCNKLLSRYMLPNDNFRDSTWAIFNTYCEGYEKRVLSNPIKLTFNWCKSFSCTTVGFLFVNTIRIIILVKNSDETDEAKNTTDPKNLYDCLNSTWSANKTTN